MSLDLHSLLEDYRSGARNPVDVIHALASRAAHEDPAIWIYRLDEAELEGHLAGLADAHPDTHPLYGIPFAIKDNIDLAGVPTTAACPAYAYTPERSATAVQQLVDAGAIPVGKTNLDQFATGLVGVRTPYGTCGNAFDASMIPGGSSSGSAVAVAKGLVTFSLGTDTAGSGRVPAAFNNLVGLKPTRGRLSTAGVVPACRSLDCVSVFALNANDARAVLQVAEGFDASEPWSRRREPDGPSLGGPFTFGVPRAEQLAFFGHPDYPALFNDSVARLEALGGTRIDIDAEPFFEAARLLYEGPWVAERFAAIRGFIGAQPEALHPVTRKIIEAGGAPLAVDAFEAGYRLRALQRKTEAVWDTLDVLVMPTAGSHYPIAEVEADPIQLNSHLGHYTNFMNLLDLSAVAVPGGFTPKGLPFGITLIAPAFHDHGLLDLAGRVHAAGGWPMGTSDHAAPEARVHRSEDWIRFAVCGAHMQGLPLNHQVTERGGRFVCEAKTAEAYALYVFPQPEPARPGMVRGDAGASLALEIWEMPLTAFGGFVQGIPAPLGIGRVELVNGEWVNGFLCEAHAVLDAEDISAHGGWRNWLESAQ